MKIIVGNWKMNGLIGDKESMLRELKNIITDNKIILCLPFTLLYGNNFGIDIGAQDVSQHPNGAYTGDISATMIRDSGAKYVIVGHSERRLYHNETNEIVRAKATIAIQNKLIPIICVGETLDDKNAGRTMSVIKKTLLESIPASGEYIVAYEPRWAIGSGETPTEQDIASAHETIKKALLSVKRDDVALLYGGSVNATNATKISNILNVDGLLIGGASLKSDTFLPIIKSIR